MKVFITIILFYRVISHSWVDCLSLASTEYKVYDQIFDNDFYKDVCLGYPRAYPGRDNKDINIQYTVGILNRGYFPPGANPNTTKACTNSRTQIQAQPNYSEEFPMTKVKAGTPLKLWYEMDGHRTLHPYYLFSFEKPGMLIDTYRDMLQANKIFTDLFSSPEKCNNFSKDNSLCWGTWTVPQYWTPGVYSVVWNWHWDQNPAGDEYNTCFEIEIV